MSKQQLMFHPIISSIQRIALYETKARFYLIGSNNTETRFRVLKIDRTDPRELIMVDDKVEYNKQEIHQLLYMIGTGNRSSRAAFKPVSAFGIVGFVRFLEGYYIVLVTKRRKIAVIGSHSIYKIEDTSITYIPSDTSRPLHQDEQRYLKMFQAIDLSTNFYYSYSYDITHTLQMNMAPPRRLAPALFPKPVTSSMMRRPSEGQSEEGEEAACTCREQADDEDIFETWKSQIQQRVNSGQRQILEFGVRTVPEWRFVWNSHLLSPVHSHLHPDWILYIVHGFIEQSNLNIFGRPVYLTLVARRSNRYAGTRFLKRGSNSYGDVANEVETEQIVHDSMVSSFSSGRFSSFVQMRGSIPGYWSQDISKIVPKPAISVDLSDPFCEIPAKHIDNLFRRYGSPIMILNLVKKREKKRHESLLTHEISNAVKYLNQFLPPEHLVQYFHIDMARMNKGTDSKVLDRLAAIARTVVRRTGIFLSARGCDEDLGVPGHQAGRLQTGVVRVNCVDCLDRTNTAQFAIGKCVLGYQLYALGLVGNPVLQFDSDCIRLLEGLYEDHGDTLALQYGGSQLVHRIKTYRKTAPWSSHGNDIMQTLSRYYSNTFSDAEKQNTMNLFLGLFVPEASKRPIWDAPSDYYLHHPEAVVFRHNLRQSLTEWWSKETMRYLPRPTNEMTKLCCEIIGIQGDRAAQLEMVDPYHDYHRPFEYTTLAEGLEFEMCHTLRDLAPSLSENMSPFVVRGAAVGKPASKNPVITGRASTTSNQSSDSNSDSSTEDDLTYSTPSTRQVSPCALRAVVRALSEPVTHRDHPFPAIKRGNRIVLREPAKRDMLMYKRYVNFDRKSSKIQSSAGSINLTVSSAFSIVDSTVEVIPPTVTKAAKEVYRQFVKRADGPTMPSATSMAIYQKYVNFTV